MKKLSADISTLMKRFGADVSLAKKAQRAAQVRAMWAECVDKIILEHTNAIYIINNEGAKTLIVYVDESIFAAELNARRELIKLKLLQQFNEEIEDFKILISRGAYKNNYPFKTHDEYEATQVESITLSDSEKEKVNEITSQIEDEKLRASLTKAITSDWEWKKGIEKKQLGNKN